MHVKSKPQFRRIFWIGAYLCCTMTTKTSVRGAILLLFIQHCFLWEKHVQCVLIIAK